MNRGISKGEMSVRLAGRTLVLCYTINSLCEMEDRAGMPLERLMNRQFSATRLLLWAGLRQRQPELSVWDVGELIGECLGEGFGLEDIVKLCTRALQASGLMLPEEEPEDGA